MEWVMLQEFDCVVARGGVGWGGRGLPNSHIVKNLKVSFN